MLLGAVGLAGFAAVDEAAATGLFAELELRVLLLICTLLMACSVLIYFGSVISLRV